MNCLPIENLSLEQALLIRALRWAINGKDSAITHESIDWSKAMDEALYHGIMPQLWWFLQSLESDVIPFDIRESLECSFQENLKHNLRLTGELWRITEMLWAEGISAIPFKGPTLAMLAYGDLAWREFTDLDVLVAERDLAKVGELLTAAGYQARADLSLLSDSVFTGLEREFYFTNSHNDILIDLQWRLSSSILPFDLNIERIRQNQITTYPGGKPIATLGLEDLLIYLCAHGARHCWERLGWIADVAGLISRNPQLDWDLALKQAHALKCLRVLLHGLSLAQYLIDVQIPTAIERYACEDADTCALTNSISRTLFQPPGSSASKFNLHRYFLKLQHRPTDQIRHLLRLIFKPTVIDWEFCPLPNALMFLYPFVRAIRLVAERLPFSHSHKPSN